MLTIKDLVIKNNQQNIILVDHLSFTLNKNDKIAIIGSEGSGKSTLLNVIANKELSYISYTGEIIRPDVLVYVEQVISKENQKLKVIDFLSDSIYEIIEPFSKLFQTFQLKYTDYKDRIIETLSGGEKAKINLIKGLITNPDVLLLDEPSNDVDFETLMTLEDFMIDTSIPILFISHDQRLLENVSNGIIHLMHVKKKTVAKTIYKQVDYKTYKDQHQNKYISDLMIARKQRSDYDKKMEKFNQIYNKVEHQQNQAVRDPDVGRLLKKKIKSLKSQEKRYIKEKEDFIDIPEKEEPMFLFFEEHDFKNNQKILIDLNIDDFKLKNGSTIKKIQLHVKASEKIVITGENGVGKTTLIKYIINYLDEKNIKYGYISQNYLDILNPMDKIIHFLLNHQEKYNEVKLRQILGTLGFKKDEMDYKIGAISEGSKLKLLLLLMISKDSQILILDEPTRNISPLNQDELYDLFLMFKGSIIAVTHDRSFIENVFDNVYQLTKDELKKII